MCEESHLNDYKNLRTPVNSDNGSVVWPAINLGSRKIGIRDWVVSEDK